VVSLIAGSTGSALRAVRPPNLHITPDCSARSRSRRERDGFLIALTLGHHGPSHSCDLVGERDRGNVSGRGDDDPGLIEPVEDEAIATS
jgi:hypothetical protein